MVSALNEPLTLTTSAGVSRWATLMSNVPLHVVPDSVSVIVPSLLSQSSSSVAAGLHDGRVV